MHANNKHKTQYTHARTRRTHCNKDVARGGARDLSPSIKMLPHTSKTQIMNKIQIFRNFS